MNYRVRKFVGTLANFYLIVLTWKFVHGELSWGLAAGCIFVSSLWLVLTRLELKTALHTYFDILSRLKVLVPILTGAALCAAAIFADASVALRAVAGIELVAWLWVYSIYRHNRKQYITLGHGPVPKGTAINPPEEALPPGTLILTSGRMATRIHESVGHGELVLLTPEGEKVTFSTYMEHGTVINPIAKITHVQTHGHYIALTPAKPWTAAQIRLSYELAQIMLRQNIDWREAKQAKRDRLITSLPLPGSWKKWLGKKFRVTGYDWLGLFLGRLATDHWTCIGSDLDLLHRMGIKTLDYGTGVLGLGTGVLDPIKPARFIGDPAFHLLTDEDVVVAHGMRR